ncbi:MAG: dienelactone hydrolase family protein [Acidobacteriota bacterium]
MGADTGARMTGRLQAETDDVLAALDYAKGLPDIDIHRIGIMGWSFGGIISVFAASRSDGFYAIVDQAGGSLTWNRSRELQTAMQDAARKIRIPLLCLGAENDATTESVKSVCDNAARNGADAAVTIYPPFTPTQNLNNVAPGHLLFSGQGVAVWGQDVVRFFNTHRPRRD